MKIDKKYNQIKKLRDKRPKLTLNEIGATFKPPITGERVRQILNPVEYKKCEKHRNSYLEFCIYCFIVENYPKVVAKLIKKGGIYLKSEFDRLSKKDKTKETAFQKAILVKALLDTGKWTTKQIGKELKRDFTDIIYLKNKKI